MMFGLPGFRATSVQQSWCKNKVFCQTFVHKSLWVSKEQSPLGARRNERNVLSVKAPLQVNFSIQVLD